MFTNTFTLLRTTAASSGGCAPPQPSKPTAAGPAPFRLLAVVNIFPKFPTTCWIPSPRGITILSRKPQGVVVGSGGWNSQHSRLSSGVPVRVGLEDSLYLERGRLAVSNSKQVVKIRRIIEGLGQQVATPDEVRQWLGLKGSQAVAF
jgi:beta-keto acid cleavage enzyme